jgi:phosphoglycolate phosphatase
MSTTPRTVIFDFDYTLADSSVGIIDCIQTAQLGMELPGSSEDAIRRTIGLSVPEILSTLNGSEQSHRVDEFRKRFQSRADEVMADNTFVYEGVPGIFQNLADRGIRNAIASTKFRYRIEGILQREGLAPLVHTVVGAEDVAEHKPDPACLQLALTQTKADATQALYVGDSLADAEAAQRAAIDFVAVLTGTTTATDFAAFASVAILEDVAALPEWMT